MYIHILHIKIILWKSINRQPIIYIAVICCICFLSGCRSSRLATISRSSPPTTSTNLSQLFASKFPISGQTAIVPYAEIQDIANLVKAEDVEKIEFDSGPYDSFSGIFYVADINAIQSILRSFKSASTPSIVPNMLGDTMNIFLKVKNNMPQEYIKVCFASGTAGLNISPEFQIVLAIRNFS